MLSYFEKAIKLQSFLRDQNKIRGRNTTVRVCKNSMGEAWDDNLFPLAYLITLRTFGTWLHGDDRESVDRHGKNIHGTPRIAANVNFQRQMQERTAEPAFLLDKKQRTVVEKTIEEVCQSRNYFLHAVNTRSNHVHMVVSAQDKPEKLINAFKTYSTRRLREQRFIDRETRLWSRGGSRRYLWKHGMLILL